MPLASQGRLTIVVSVLTRRPIQNGVIMKFRLSFQIALLCSLLAQDDRKSIQGEWTIQSVENPSAPWLQKIGQGSIITVDGSRITPKEKTIVAGQLLYSIAPGRVPKQIDVRLITEDKEEITLLGLYELSDKELKILLSIPNRPRPTEFRTKPKGKEEQFWSFKRVANP